MMNVDRDMTPLAEHQPPREKPEDQKSVVIRNSELVFDTHAEWFGRIMRWTFYPEDNRSKTPIPPPEDFSIWLEQVRADQNADIQTLSDISRLYQDLRQTADRIVSVAAGGQKPEIETFDYFVDLYDEFNNKIRRLEMDCVLSDSGIDSLTGFRSRQIMFPDLERELERRNRRGRPFCIAYLRIDFFDAILKSMGQDAARDLVRRASGIMKKCMRTYDDAYRYGPGEIVWSLKHSDITGGMRAIERLRRMLEDEDIRVTVGGKSRYFTMSYIVSEPVPGDVLPETLAQMRADLDKFADEPDTYLQHKEVSRLQVFVDQSEGTSTQDSGGKPDLS